MNLLVTLMLSVAASGSFNTNGVFEVKPAGRFIVVPSAPPPTKTTLHIDNIVTGDAHVIEWDPVVPRSLARPVLLEEGDWQISVRSQSDRNSKFENVNYAWEFQSAKGNELSLMHFATEYPCTTASETVPTACLKVAEQKITISASSLKKSNDALKQFNQVVTQQSSSYSLNLSRSLGETVVDDLLQTVATVAVKRASTKTERLAQEIAEKRICSLEDTNRKKLFSSTCATVKSVQLANLAGTGRALNEAVRRDLLDLMSLTGPATEIFARPIAPGRASLELLQAVLQANGAPSEFQFAALILADCGRLGECSRGDIDAYFAFNKSKHLAPFTATPHAKEGELKKLIAIGIELLTDRESAAPARLERAVTFWEAALRYRGKASANLGKCASLLRSLAREDLAGAMVAAAALLPGDKQAQSAIRVISSLTAYVSSYSGVDANDEENAKARTEALGALVDGLAERKGREGLIVSLGVNVGVNGSLRFDGANLTSGLSPALPVGLTLDYFLQDIPIGVTGMVYGLDVGQYADLDFGLANIGPKNATPYNALALGLRAGVLFGDHELPISLAIDARYAPSLTPDASQLAPAGGGTFQFGLSLGIYIPFFDLN